MNTRVEGVGRQFREYFPNNVQSYPYIILLVRISANPGRASCPCAVESDDGLVASRLGFLRFYSSLHGRRKCKPLLFYMHKNTVKYLSAGKLASRGRVLHRSQSPTLIRLLSNGQPIISSATKPVETPAHKRDDVMRADGFPHRRALIYVTSELNGRLLPMRVRQPPPCFHQ